jgi:hypothetical protein
MGGHRPAATARTAQPSASKLAFRINSQLLLEKVFEGGARVAGARGGGGILLLGSVFGGGRYWRGVFFDGHAVLEKGASVLRALLHDRLRNGLRAFPLGCSVEIYALLAAVQLETAARTGAIGVESGGQDITATRTARPKDCADHPRRARAYLLLARGARLLLLSLAFFRLARVLVTVLPVFSIQIDLPEHRSSIAGVGTW